MALLGVGVLVIAVIALRHPGNRAATAGALTNHSTTAAPSSHSTTSAAARRTTAPRASAAPTSAAKLPLVVLNNTSTSGLAQTAAARFQAGGWTVTGTGNLSGSIVSTCAYYDPNVSGANAAASALETQFPTIKRVAPKFSGLPAGPIVVVLTSDYTSG
ncbi:MAG: LytR C-terminal domain-containing protein [Actinomycetota bacterium]|nr:LytR C-terminal domain-containing protein [Actinomycetota bacterium]